MKKIRRIEITTFQEQTVQVRRVGTGTWQWCPGCQQKTRMWTPDEVATRLGIGVRTIFRGIESGQVHFIETTQGHIFLCSHSVTALAPVQRSFS